MSSLLAKATWDSPTINDMVYYRQQISTKSLEEREYIDIIIWTHEKSSKIMFAYIFFIFGVHIISIFVFVAPSFVSIIRISKRRTSLESEFLTKGRS